MADPLLDELWSRVVADFRDDALHRAFVEHCRRTDQLEVAARRYVESKRAPDPYRSDGDRERIADGQLKAIAALAMFQLEGSRRVREVRRERILGLRRGARWAVFLLMLAGLAAWVARHR